MRLYIRAAEDLIFLAGDHLLCILCIADIFKGQLCSAGVICLHALNIE